MSIRFTWLLCVCLLGCVKPQSEKSRPAAPQSAPVTTEGPLGRKSPVSNPPAVNPASQEMPGSETPASTPPPLKSETENPANPGASPLPAVVPAPTPAMIPKGVDIGTPIKDDNDLLPGIYSLNVLGRCLTAAAKTSGSAMKLAVCDGSAAQNFQIDRVEGYFFFKISSVFSGMNIQIRGGGKTDEALLEQGPFDKALDQQQLTIEERKGGLYIKMKHSEKFLEAAADGTVLQRTDSGQPNQLWTIARKSLAETPDDGSGRRYRVQNKCTHPVWVGTAANPGFPNIPDGDFKLDPGGSHTIKTIEKWEGRLWGRYGCAVDANGKFTCASGDCFKGEKCEGHWGETPVTLAEIRTHSSFQDLDFYNISWVDGANLTMEFKPIEGTFKATGSVDYCRVLSCKNDMRAKCPGELQKKDKQGRVVGCLSACEVFKTDAYCCLGAFAEDKCKPTSYSKLFKEVCPIAYSYAMDTGAYSCKGADYEITFCP